MERGEVGPDKEFGESLVQKGSRWTLVGLSNSQTLPPRRPNDEILSVIDTKRRRPMASSTGAAERKRLESAVAAA